MCKRGVFGYHARGRREFGSLAAAASEEEQRGRREGRVERRTERPRPVGRGAGRRDDPLGGGASKERLATEPDGQF